MTKIRLSSSWYVLFAQVSCLSSAKELCCLNKERASARLGALGAPPKNKIVTQVYQALGKAELPLSRLSYVPLNLWSCILSFRRWFETQNQNKRYESGYAEWLTNRPILLTVRLTATIRFFAGEEVYDINVTFGISHTCVFGRYCLLSECNVHTPVSHTSFAHTM